MLEVDDVDLVTGTKDVLIHLGVPITGLVTEMGACLKQFAHAYLRHNKYLSNWVKPPHTPVTKPVKPAPWNRC